MTPQGVRLSGRAGVALALLSLFAFPLVADERAPPPQTARINRLIAATWPAHGLKPAERCTDHEFIRRASLDIIGRIATVEEIERYLKDEPGTRRAQLIDRLLAGKEYERYWATRWTHWLMTRCRHPLHREQMRHWLEEEVFAKDLSHREMVERLLTATGKTNDNGAVTFLLANLGVPTAELYPELPEAQRLARHGQFDMAPATSRSAQLFLGCQLACVQCHDHPFNPDWKQRDFWGLNACFRQVRRVGEPGEREWQLMPNHMCGLQHLAASCADDGLARIPIVSLEDDPKSNASGVVFFEKRNGVILPREPIFLDGRKLAAGKESRRAQAARLFTSHPFFAPAYVNRMWAQLFGRGLNEKPAYDDFGSHNGVVHAALLERLAKDFIAGGHKPKDVIRWICLSEPYQLKSAANPTNDKPDDEVHFSRQLLTPLSPEQLGDSLLTAADLLHREGEEWDRFRAGWRRGLASDFTGDDGGDDAMNQEGTARQTLRLMNGPEMQALLLGEKGPIAKAKQLPLEQAIDHLFLATLNRPATPREQRQIAAHRPLLGRIKEEDETPLLQDLFWALLNSGEFASNR